MSNFDTSSISMYSVRKISAPKKMADVPRITAVLKINSRKLSEILNYYSGMAVVKFKNLGSHYEIWRCYGGK